jgi:peptidoglycan/xylan/chitin deacetylase (PgdA/CDA1 family)
VLKAVSPGGIVLLHDGGGDRRNTVEALPQIITTLKEQGYRFVTVPELLEIEAKQTPLNEMEEE